jgi:ABC-type cobalamin/Fe3+-siderophores transport system ATPase subunit
MATHTPRLLLQMVSNWICKQTFHFLGGKNGSGKSTVIEAIVKKNWI